MNTKMNIDSHFAIVNIERSNHFFLPFFSIENEIFKMLTNIFFPFLNAFVMYLSFHYVVYKYTPFDHTAKS